MKRNLAESDIIKEIIAHPDLLTVRQIGLTDIKTDDKTLFIIGNGFDLAHGVQSAYYNFRKFLYPKSHLRQVLDNCIDRPDIWSNLEESLAYLDRELMIDNIDTMLREFKAEDEDDEDFLYGNFYSAIDWALYPIDVIVNDLPRLFRKWINSLKTPKKLDSLFNLLNEKSKYINFNYTEFLESVYGINRKNILYIHGCRKEKHSKLILGHGYEPENLFEQWYNDNKKVRRSKSNPTRLAYFKKDDNIQDYKSAMQYYAIDQAIPRIEKYYETVRKNVNSVIEEHLAFFNKITDVKQVVVIGHSLSFVDYPYFKKIIEANSYPEKIQWKMSWYGINDLARFAQFAEVLDIKKSQINLFRL